MYECELLNSSKMIAVVGISRNQDRTSRVIADYLSAVGFEVVGVNPNKKFTQAENIKVYNNLLEIPHEVDIINVFRKSEDIPELIEDVVKIRPKALWLQLGIRNDDAAVRIRKEGIIVIQDTCIKIQHGFCN